MSTITAQSVSHKDVRAYRSRAAAAYLGVGYSTFWRYCKDVADFPKPVSLTPGRVGMKVWLKTELDAWLDSRISASRAA